MLGCEFSVNSIRNHRRGIHAPEVRFERGELVMLGRSIPVISREQLEERLAQIGCEGEVAEEIVGNLFGFRVPSEASVALTEVSEDIF